MARPKKQTTTETEEKKTTTKKKTATKKEAKTEKKEEAIINPEDTSLQEAMKVAEAHKKMKKLYLTTNTPSVKTPSVVVNSIETIPADTIVYVEDEIHNDEGDFWKIEGDRYINKTWNVKEL